MASSADTSRWHEDPHGLPDDLAALQGAGQLPGQILGLVQRLGVGEGDRRLAGELGGRVLAGRERPSSPP